VSGRPLRVAFCGAQHPHVFPRLELLAGRPDVELVGLHEPERRVREAVAARYGVEAAGSVEELAGRRPDLAIVEGLDHENPDYAVELARAGCDLLIEKPGANRVSRMREMVEAVAATPVHAQVGYMLRSSPVVPRLKALLEGGALGAVTLARFHAAAPVGCAAEIWQSLPDDEGGVLYTDGCHMMDLILHLLGRPVAVQGLVKRLPPGPEAVSRQFKPDVLAGLGEVRTFRLGELVHEDCAGALLDFRDTLAVLDVTGWEAHGWVEEWRIELYGTRGTAYAGLMPPWLRVFRSEEAGGALAGWEELRPSGAPTGAAVSLVPDVSYQTELEALLARLRRGERDQAGLRHALAVVETLTAIFRSSADAGRRVEL
jgi:predicted dehydrogenase